jgi:hypothetical protein
MQQKSLEAEIERISSFYAEPGNREALKAAVKKLIEEHSGSIPEPSSFQYPVELTAIFAPLP